MCAHLQILQDGLQFVFHPKWLNAFPLNELHPNAIATGKAGADLNSEKPIIKLKEHTKLLEATHSEKFLNRIDEKAEERRVMSVPPTLRETR